MKKYTKLTQQWITKNGRVDSTSEIFEFSKEVVLRAIAQDKSLHAHVARDLREQGESHFIDSSSGERTIVYLFEYERKKFV